MTVSQKELTQIGVKWWTDKAYFHSFTEFYNDYYFKAFFENTQ